MKIVSCAFHVFSSSAAGRHIGVNLPGSVLSFMKRLLVILYKDSTTIHEQFSQNFAD